MSANIGKIADLIGLKLDNTVSYSAKIWVNNLYHFTDIKNIEAIFKKGRLMSRKLLEESNVSFYDTASKEVMSQTNKEIFENCRLYFGPRTPMLDSVEGYDRQKVNNYEVHCPVPVYLLFDTDEIFEKEGIRFSDGNAASRYTNIYSSIAELNKLNFEMIYHRGQIKDTDNKLEILRCRHAEVLVPNEIDVSLVSKVVCRSYADRDYMLHIFARNLITDIEVKVDETFYHNVSNVYLKNVNLLRDKVIFDINRISSLNITLEITRQFDGKNITVTADLSSTSASIKWKHDVNGSYQIRIYFDRQLMYENSFMHNEMPF